MRQVDFEKVLDFAIENLKYPDRELLKKYIEEHLKYGTIDYAIDTNNNIVGYVRFNILDDVWDIIDFAVDKKWRRKGIGKDLILRGLERFPTGKYIKFERVLRGDNRIRKLPIERIIKQEIL